MQVTRWGALLRLLLLSRPFRGLLAGLVAAAALVALTAVTIGALTLSGDQEVTKSLGASTLRIQDSSAPAMRPGDSQPAHPHWLSELGKSASLVVAQVWSQVSLSGNGGDQWSVNYLEFSSALPTDAIEGNTVLTAGRWPTSPGECLATGGLPDEPVPALGTWPLRVVGRGYEVFAPESTTIICAAGTWQSWMLKAAEREMTADSAQLTYFLSGEESSLQEAAWRLQQSGELPAADVGAGSVDLTFASYFVRDTRSAFRILGTTAPLLVLPMGLALLLAGGLGRWRARVAQVLLTIGITPRSFNRVIGAAVALSSFGASVLGVIVGLFLSFAARPLVTWLNRGVPLSPWALPSELATVPILAAASAGAGLFLGTLLDRPSSAERRKGSGRPVTHAALLGATVTAIGILVLATSAGRTWWMMSGSVATLAGVLFFAPMLVDVAAGKGRRARPSAWLLVRRLFEEDTQRHAVSVATLGSVMGLTLVTFVLSTASSAAMLPLYASQVPPGVVLLETVDATGRRTDEHIIRQFETDIGVSDPITITETMVLPGNGYVWNFESLADAQDVLGELPADLIDALERGAILTPFADGASSMEFNVNGGAQTFQLPTRTLALNSERRFKTAGVAIRDRLPEEGQDTAAARAWNLYQNLTAEQDRQAASWRLATGFTAVSVAANEPAEDLKVPLWVAISLVGFGLLTAPLIFYSLRKEATQLRPMLKSAQAVGLPAGWLTSVIATQALWVVGSASVLAVTGAILPVVVLGMAYRGAAFDPSGVPWWILGGFVLGVCGGSVLAVLGAARRLTRSEGREIV